LSFCLVTSQVQMSQWIVRGHGQRRPRVTVCRERGMNGMVHGKGVARDRVLAATRVAMVHQE
jgi:hypothetical protein